MPHFEHHGQHIKYIAQAGYVLECNPYSAENVRACYEHMRVNYPHPEFVIVPEDRCVHSDNVQQTALD